MSARSRAAPVPPRAATAVPLGLAVLLAAAAGPVLDAAFPDRNIWPAVFAAVGMVLVAARGRSLGGSLLVGFVFGVAFYLPHVEWAALFLGPLPWSALATVMALWCALSTALITLAYRWVPRHWNGPVARLALVPAVVAGLWTAREAIASVWPYGGFSWGRLAFSQSDSPFSHLFAWLGVSGVTFVIVAVTAFALAAANEAMAAIRLRAPGDRRTPSDVPVLAAAAGLILVALLAVPPWTSLPGTGATGPDMPATIRIGAVQGDTKASYFDPPENFGDNLLGQVAATEPLYGEDVDLVVWPEGGSDADPLREDWAAALWDEVSERTGAPLIGGTITSRREDDGTVRFYNTVLLWRAGQGALDFYDKKHPVPFGEYVPDRAFWRIFAPDLIDLVEREYTPGTTDAVMDLGAGDPGSRFSGVLAGHAICFDIVDDQLLTEMVEQGAGLILAETNNADFGRTDESVQQLAIARIRAVETARAVVNISTVGTSAIVLPDGTIAEQLPWYTPAVMVADVPLGTTTTPAVVIGREVEWAVSGFGILMLMAAGISSIGRAGDRRERGPRPGTRSVRSRRRARTRG